VPEPPFHKCEMGVLALRGGKKSDHRLIHKAGRAPKAACVKSALQPDTTPLAVTNEAGFAAESPGDRSHQLPATPVVLRAKRSASVPTAAAWRCSSETDKTNNAPDAFAAAALGDVHPAAPFSALFQLPGAARTSLSTLFGTRALAASSGAKLIAPQIFNPTRKLL